MYVYIFKCVCIFKYNIHHESLLSYIQPISLLLASLTFAFSSSTWENAKRSSNFSGLQMDVKPLQPGWSSSNGSLSRWRKTQKESIPIFFNAQKMQQLFFSLT